MWFDRSRFLNSPKGSFPFSISLLSWGLNEEENICDFLNRAQRFMDSLKVDYEHIFIDDGSSDRTYELAIHCQKNYPQLRLIKNPYNRGSGWNTRIAVSHATKDFLFWQTSDWAYDIESFRTRLPDFLEFDILQGVRAEAGSSASTVRQAIRALHPLTRSDNKWKATVSIVNYLLIRVLFRAPVLDFQNVTIYPTKLAQSLKLESHSAFTNPEMLLKAYWKGASIQQIPVLFFPRTKGTAKGTRLKTILRSVWEIIFFRAKWFLLGESDRKNCGRIVDP